MVVVTQCAIRLWNLQYFIYYRLDLDHYYRLTVYIYVGSMTVKVKSTFFSDHHHDRMFLALWFNPTLVALLFLG